MLQTCSPSTPLPGTQGPPGKWTQTSRQSFPCPWGCRVERNLSFMHVAMKDPQKINAVSPHSLFSTDGEHWGMHPMGKNMFVIRRCVGPQGDYWVGNLQSGVQIMESHLVLSYLLACG